MTARDVSKKVAQLVVVQSQRLQPLLRAVPVVLCVLLCCGL